MKTSHPTSSFLKKCCAYWVATTRTCTLPYTAYHVNHEDHEYLVAALSYIENLLQPIYQHRNFDAGYAARRADQDMFLTIYATAKCSCQQWHACQSVICQDIKMYIRISSEVPWCYSRFCRVQVRKHACKFVLQPMVHTMVSCKHRCNRCHFIHDGPVV